MAQPFENSPIDGAVELLKSNGFDALAEAVTVLLNTAMVAERSEHLGAAPYERSAGRIGYANGYKDKQLKTRLGAFPDGHSALMLVAARLRHVSATQWGARKYMNMELLKEMDREVRYLSA